jgi:hypothetical protein
MILNACVTEPVEEKTVSYFNVSAVIVTLASGEVINDSFRHEKKATSKQQVRARFTAFI